MNRNPRKYVVIGGVAGGATAAARLRRSDEQAQIVLIEKGKYISYANCGLPYYIGGTIEEREKLFVQTPQAFARRFAVDVRVENEAVAIDRTAKTVTVKRADGTLYAESFDKLLLSPGAVAVIPPLKCTGWADRSLREICMDESLSSGIFTLRNVSDTDRIKNYISTHSVKKAVIVGAGFIGLEMAENLHQIGAAVTIVEMGSQVMAPIDYSMASFVHQHLEQKGVGLMLGKQVSAFEKSDEGVNVLLASGEQIQADMVILSIGVRPLTTLAQQAGLEIGRSGGIRVNEYLQSSDPDIYAVGDAIEFANPITGTPYMNYLANPANRQGRIVADNMIGENLTPYEGAIATSIAKVFDMTVASTGMPAKRLKQAGIDYLSSTTTSSSHAGYYPGAMPMTLKITFSAESGRVLGAQCVGYEGVDKRIDQIALLIKMGGTVYDLIRLEHAYAPPFSSAKDPIAIAGYVASNIISGKMPVIYWRELEEAVNSGSDNFQLIDVRTADEFALGSIRGAVNIPLDDLRENLDRIATDRPVYLFCAIGLRGYLAQQILRGRGFDNVKNLSGGYKLYSLATAEVAASVASAKSEPESKVCLAPKKILKVDACGLQCPGPIMKVKSGIDSLTEGEQLEVLSTDPGFARDVKSWCSSTGNNLLSSDSDKGVFRVIIEKGESLNCKVQTAEQKAKGKSFILFSDDLDKALATFVLANGAAATGEKVTIFFTFWGLNAIKKNNKPKVRKDIFGRMFSMMLPSSSKKLTLSKMSMMGLGGKMMRYIMKRKGIESLENLRQQAISQGVEFIACQMSMDVMGVSKEELLDNVTIGGVATYMQRAEQSNVNLFI